MSDDVPTPPDDLPEGGLFVWLRTLAPKEAIAFLERKGFAIGFDWRDVWQEEHARAFTVAKMMSRELLETVRGEVQRALDEGTTLADFSRELRPRLEAAGWWGRKAMVDPLTGERKIVQLGSPRRLRVIFNTNLRTAYQAGRWERIQRTKQAFPFLRYVSVMDGRERPQHRAWHGTILPVDDPWWDTHYGPCDWGCRCTATPLNLRQIERRGYTLTIDPERFPTRSYINPRTGEITKLEEGIGPGWSYNVGKAYLDGLAPAPAGGSAPAAMSITASIGSSAAVPREADAFVARFGGPKVWEDAGGYPLAISLGWFRRPDGSIDELAASEGGAIARLLRDAAIIGWTWSTDGGGHRKLHRRYAAPSTSGSGWDTLEVGGDYWMMRQVEGEAAATAQLHAVIRPRSIASPA